MGIHGNATCQMNLDGAVGTLVGEPNKGLQAMFVMMNAARLGVGNQSLGLTEVAYQNALAYAKDRIQMRSLSGPKAPDKPADPIIVHPDVRKMLLTAKAYAEGGRALAMLLRGAARTRSTPPGREGAQGQRRAARAADADRQGLPDRQRLAATNACACRSSAAMATSRNGAWSSSCAMRAST
jgi:alkylation response protein AidB-like acyl-CoA dehydrogenase